MRTVIEKLENQLRLTSGLNVLEKRDDGFAYCVALQVNGETYVVFTTKGFHNFRKDSCLLYMKVTEHLSFEEVTPTANGDFIVPYTRAVASKGLQIGDQVYGLSVDELPIFQAS